MAEEHESSAMPFHISIVQTDTIVIGKGDNATFGIEYSYSEEIFVSELKLQKLLRFTVRKSFLKLERKIKQLPILLQGLIQGKLQSLLLIS